MITFPMRPSPGADLGRYVATKRRIFPNRPVFDGTVSAEPKIDGIRVVVDLKTGACWNRHGNRLVDEVRYALCVADLRARFEGTDVEAVDCESIGRRGRDPVCLFVIDVIGGATRVLDYTSRRELMESLIPVWQWDVPAPDSVVLMPSCAPEAIWTRALECRQAAATSEEFPLLEGMVVKQRGSIYATQVSSATRITPSWLKFRFRDSGPVPPEFSLEGEFALSDAAE